MTGTSEPRPGDDRQSCLSVAGLRKVFGETVALRRGDLEVRPGEVHALLGENGAGKSTLIKILAGVHTADEGTIEISSNDGRPARMAFIHQDPAVFPGMSVAENMALLTTYPVTGPLVRWRRVRERAAAILDSLDLKHIDPAAAVDSLPVAARTMIAIAAASANDATLLVLDEPTASLSAHEVDLLFGVIQRLRSRGIAVLLVTHRLDEVIRICDRVTVLRDGVTVGVAAVAKTSEHDLVRMITGHDVTPRPQSVLQPGAHRLEVRNLAAPGLIGPITLALGEGEILGLTGTLEAGHHVIGEVLYGLLPRVRGECTLMGRAYDVRNPGEAIARGVRYLPPDRHQLGLAPHLSIRENLFMNAMPTTGRTRRLGPYVGTAGERRDVQAILRKFDVRPARPDIEVSTLSGGNAQKVLLARCFHDEANLVILTEPTAGVDIGARSSIYSVIRAEAARGRSVLVISSDFAEVKELCDRCLVVRHGRIVAEYRVGEMSVSAITGAAL